MSDADVNLSSGLRGKAEDTVDASNTARRYASGALEVYATPAMIGLMEAAAVDALEGALPKGWTSVGISLDVRHLAPTPPGMVVRAEAVLEEIKGKRLVFAVSAYDQREKIGEGIHQRYCVETADFLARVGEKVAG